MRNRVGPPGLKPNVKLSIGSAADVSGRRMNEHAATEEQDRQREVEQKCARGLTVEEVGNARSVRHLLAEKFQTTPSDSNNPRVPPLCNGRARQWIANQRGAIAAERFASMADVDCFE